MITDDIRAEQLDYESVNAFVSSSLAATGNQPLAKNKKIEVSCFIYDDYDHQYIKKRKLLSIVYKAELKINKVWTHGDIHIEYYFKGDKIVSNKILNIVLESRNIA